MATLGKNIAKGKYNEDKIEAAIPAIHPGFRLQVRISVGQPYLESDAINDHTDSPGKFYWTPHDIGGTTLLM